MDPGDVEKWKKRIIEKDRDLALQKACEYSIRLNY